MKKGSLAVIISVLFGTALFLAVVLFYSSIVKRLKSELQQEKTMARSKQEEMQRLQDEKDKATRDNEKLEQDTISYMALNSRLQEQNEELQKNLEEVRKAREKGLISLRKKSADLEKALNDRENILAQYNKLSSLTDEQKKKVDALSDSLKKERSLYHYNLGVAYSQAKLYFDAIDEYKKSLEFDPDNADSYYNLGILYENYKQDSEKAIDCYRKYLGLKPDAADKYKVEGWIKKLKGI
ncbi:MAG: tetratricopeptide repeat protein [Candidatus Omnitrophica bacterium]|nr:tetratricopeptide repeat protein [Candidatus Omnitrophota bacterium]